MAELTERQREEMVILLARYRSPAEVSVHMKTEHGLDVPIQQVVKYDPTRAAFEAAIKWRELFEIHREAYIKDVSQVPVANQAFRLNLLQEGIEAAKKAKNWKLVAELAEQASKEAGGVFTNVRDVNVNDGRRPRDLSHEDRMAQLASILAEALDKRASQPAIPKE